MRDAAIFLTEWFGFLKKNTQEGNCWIVWSFTSNLWKIRVPQWLRQLASPRSVLRQRRHWGEPGALSWRDALGATWACRRPGTSGAPRWQVGCMGRWGRQGGARGLGLDSQEPAGNLVNTQEVTWCNGSHLGPLGASQGCSASRCRGVCVRGGGPRIAGVTGGCRSCLASLESARAGVSLGSGSVQPAGSPMGRAWGLSPSWASAGEPPRVAGGGSASLVESGAHVSLQLERCQPLSALGRLGLGEAVTPCSWRLFSFQCFIKGCDPHLQSWALGKAFSCADSCSNVLCHWFCRRVVFGAGWEGAVSSSNSCASILLRSRASRSKC